MRGRDKELHVNTPGGRIIVSLVLSLVMMLVWGHYNRGEAEQPAKGRQKTDLNLITTPIGSATYTVAVGQGMLLNKKLPNFKVAVQPASGALALPRLLAKGEGDMITIAAPTVYWAYKGEEGFSTPIASLRLLQSGNDMYFAFLTRSDTGIRSIEQLKGRRVIYEIPSARMITMLGMLELQAYGLDPKKDVAPSKAEFPPTALTNLMERRTDAIMASLGISTMIEADKKVGIKVLPFAESKVPFIRQNLPAFFGTKTPTGLPGVSPDVPVVATVQILVANEDMDDTTAYMVVKTLVENHKDLFPIHKDFYGWTPERAVRDLGIPYHPGAIKCYKEKGLWTSEMEERQRQMLATGK